MKFSEWIADQPQNEDWSKVWGAAKDIWDRKGRVERKKQTQKDNRENPPPAKEPENVEKAEKWWDQLLQYAEQGRQKAEDWFFSPGSDVSKQISGEEDGDPGVTILKRMAGWVGGTLFKLLMFVVNKVLHLPTMYKFFRHDTVKIGKDALRGTALAVKNPTQKRAWGAMGQHLLNLVRYPVAMVAMGIGAKLSYQQYQALQAFGFTDIDLTAVIKANVVICWLMFLCFLTPLWFAGSNNRVMRGIAGLMKRMFPQQMYQGKAHMGESFREWALTKDVREWTK